MLSYSAHHEGISPNGSGIADESQCQVHRGGIAPESVCAESLELKLCRACMYWAKRLMLTARVADTTFIGLGRAAFLRAGILHGR